MKIKSHFPQTQNQIYLNTAACGLLSTTVLEQKHKDNSMFFEKGKDFLNNEEEIVTQTKENIADIFKASPNRIAITANFSLPFNAVLDAIDNSARFLCLTEDYPSVILPIKSRGFRCDTISISENIEHDIYDHIKNHKPDVLALSKVQYLGGIHLETSFFQNLKQDFPNLKILVDATQYLGVEEFDFNDSGIDLMIASGYKWINAGLGSAIVMMSDALYEELASPQIGANSLKDKAKSLSKPMGFLEPGHYDLIAIRSLQTALDLHYHQIGISKISKHIKLLSERAFEAFKGRNLLDEKVYKRNQHSSIFNLNISQDKFQEFEQAHVKLSKRGNGLRVSFHYYNTIDDLKRFLEFLKA